MRLCVAFVLLPIWLTPRQTATSRILNRKALVPLRSRHRLNPQTRGSPTVGSIGLMTPTSVPIPAT